MSLQHRTPLSAFLHWEKQQPDRLFLRQPVNGQWFQYSYGEAGRRVRSIANYLSSNLAPRSKVAILSKNCAEWIIVDLAIMMSGHISVPIYPTLSAESIRPLLEHSETKLLFVGKLDSFEQQSDGIPADVERIYFDAYGHTSGTLLSKIINNVEPVSALQEPQPDDLATIMYSSGTTGAPKGVMLTHGAFAFVGEKVAAGLAIVGPERFFSYLPLSHIAERALMEMVVLASGSAISFTESLEKFPSNLEQEQPTIFGGVPRIYSKFQEGVLRKMPQKRLRTLLSIPLIRSLIRKTIKRKLGLSQARVIVTGAAPTPVSLLAWFRTIGLEIREIYGLTENTAFSHANYRQNKIGTVGEPWPDAECRLSEEGEILIRHAALMLGYYKDEATTAAVFTDDGFLRTGDKGEIDSDGFLTITGRVKDQFKTDKAKFIAPAKIELLMMDNPDIEQVCVVGIGLPQPVALVILSSIGTAKSASEVEMSLSETAAKVNKSLEGFERIEKVIVVNDTWSIDNGMLTPSLKLKRNEVEKKYQGQYWAWYRTPGMVIRQQ